MTTTQIIGAIVATVSGSAFVINVVRRHLALWRLRRMMRDLDRSNES